MYRLQQGSQWRRIKCDRRSLSFDATLVASGQRHCLSAMKDYCQSLDVREEFDLLTGCVR